MDIQPGDTLVWQVPHERSRSVQVKITPRKWGQHMKGLGKSLWRGIDAQEYVKNLRQDRTLS